MRGYTGGGLLKAEVRAAIEKGCSEKRPVKKSPEVVLE